MGLYVLRRFINSLILVSIASVMGYMLVSISLNPEQRYLSREPKPPQSTIDGIMNAQGTNPHTPLLERTGTWVKNIIFHFNFGKDLSGMTVVHDIAQRSLVSLQLLTIATAFSVVLGVALGVWGAVHQYKASDQVITFTNYLIFATPVFVLGVILMIVMVQVNNHLGTNIQFTGQYTPGTSGTWNIIVDRLGHLLLPTVTMILSSAASYSMYQRNLMLDVLASDYIRTARAKGRTRNSALIRHGVRVALIPMTVFFSYSIVLMVTGASFIELVFSWHGMGELAMNSINQNDINATAGSLVYIAVLVLVATVLADIVYAALDPRVRV